MSPLGISILLHFHCSSSPYIHHWTPNGYPEVVKKFMLWAEDAQLIYDGSKQCKRCEDTAFTLTPRGKAYVDRLMSTPLPRKVETWVFDEPDGDQ
jgi:hypothetical protein